VNLHRAIVESCDVYFYKLGKKLGIDRIASYAKQFGLGRATGFDTGRERSGLIPSKAWKLRKWGVPWQAGETISTSIGQSFVLATPLQMATLISAVFNGGILYEPQATERVEKSDGHTSYRFKPKIKARLNIAPAHLEVVKRALTGAVNEPGGTGGRASLETISVAGKTGTSQVITIEKQKALKSGGELPARFRDHAWFVAVAPSESPEIAVAVVIEHGGQGGRAAAPIAGTLIKAYLSDRGPKERPDIPVTETAAEAKEEMDSGA
jgi:penicillin-binding protein 2